MRRGENRRNLSRPHAHIRTHPRAGRPQKEPEAELAAVAVAPCGDAHPQRTQRCDSNLRRTNDSFTHILDSTRNQSGKEETKHSSLPPPASRPSAPIPRITSLLLFLPFLLAACVLPFRQGNQANEGGRCRFHSRSSPGHGCVSSSSSFPPVRSP